MNRWDTRANQSLDRLDKWMDTSHIMKVVKVVLGLLFYLSLVVAFVWSLVVGFWGFAILLLFPIGGFCYSFYLIYKKLGVKKWLVK